MRPPKKAIKTAIDMISSYLLTPCLVALINSREFPGFESSSTPFSTPFSMTTWSWSDLGRSWGGFWAILGRSWPVLGRSWAILGRSWVVLGRSWTIFGRSWGVLGRSWAALGASRGDPKSIKKSIRNLIRKQAESRRKKMAQTVRLSVFQSLT